MPVELLFLLFGLALGLVAGWLVTRAGTARAQAQVELLTQQVKERDAQIESSAKVSTAMESLELKVKEMREYAESADRRRAESDVALTQQIRFISSANEALTAEAKKLVATLTNSASRGRFGEMQLERLLEHAGLIEGVHFTKQTKITEGIPDVTVKLPGGSEIFIDSKFPFDSFWEAEGAEGNDVKRRLLSDHAKKLLDHASVLAKRGYHNKNTSPDFVVLFAPVESILSVALEVEPLLLDQMFEKKVVVATPSTMLALLRTIGYGYSQQDMAHNAAEIRDLASELLKRIVTMHGKLETLGERIKSSGKAFDDLMATAENNVLVPARKMIKLGVPATKPLTSLEPLDLSVRELKAISSRDDFEESE